MADDPRLAAMRSLADTGLRLARTTRSAKLALAGLHGVVDPAGLPPEIRPRVMAELERAAAEVLVALPAREVEKALKAAWGATPGKVLDALDLDAPVAITPSAQVHRGVHDGVEVAVKVLRPGLAEAIRGDLGLADALVRPLGAAFPAVDPGALVREVRERILDELDLEHEASVQRSFARALRRHTEFHVPAPVTELCHERVLVSAWVDGTRLRDVTDPEDRALAARRLVVFHVGSARFGTVHADPHPDNALLMGDGRLALLDFGAVRRLQTGRVDLALAALDAVAADDDAAFARSLDDLGWLPQADGTEALALARDVLGPFLHGRTRLDHPALKALGERAWAQRERGLPLAQRGRVAPEDLWPLRMLGGLVALLASLGAEQDWLALMRSAARDGWDAAG